MCRAKAVSGSRISADFQPDQGSSHRSAERIGKANIGGKAGVRQACHDIDQRLLVCIGQVEPLARISLTQAVVQRRLCQRRFSLTWRSPRWEIGIEADNITITLGNRFFFGNPFHVRQEEQQVPLRPLNVRLSAIIQF